MIVFCLMLILLLTEQWIKRRILRETSLPRYLGRGYLLLRQYNNYGLPFSRLRQHPGAVKIIVTLIMIGALAYTMPWIVRGGGDFSPSPGSSGANLWRRAQQSTGPL